MNRTGGAKIKKLFLILFLIIILNFSIKLVEGAQLCEEAIGDECDSDCSGTSTYYIQNNVCYNSRSGGVGSPQSPYVCENQCSGGSCESADPQSDCQDQCSGEPYPWFIDSLGQCYWYDIEDLTCSQDHKCSSGGGGGTCPWATDCSTQFCCGSSAAYSDDGGDTCYTTDSCEGTQNQCGGCGLSTYFERGWCICTSSGEPTGTGSINHCTGENVMHCSPSPLPPEMCECAPSSGGGGSSDPEDCFADGDEDEDGKENWDDDDCSMNYVLFWNEQDPTINYVGQPVTDYNPTETIDDQGFLFESNPYILQTLILNYMNNVPGASTDLADYSVYFEVNSPEDYGQSLQTESEYKTDSFLELKPPTNQDSYDDFTVPLCNPDSNEDFCTGCEFGYYDSNMRGWASNAEECCGDDVVDNENNFPDFFDGHVDEPDSNAEFCEDACSFLGNSEYQKVWLSGQEDPGYCCGDDDGSLNVLFNVTGGDDANTIIEGFNNNIDCAKTINNNLLCNPSDSSKWEDSTTQIGDIIYIPCFPPTIGFEAVSDGEKWISCGELETPQQTTHQFYGEYFTKNYQIISYPTISFKHDYFCEDLSYPPPGENSIYECCGQDLTTCQSGKSTDAGQRYLTGDFFEQQNPQKIYYCTVDTERDDINIVSPSKNDPQDTLWTKDIDLTNQQSCIAAGFTWTGVFNWHKFTDYNDISTHEYFCCGEADDIESSNNGGVLYESYNDPEGPGVCFDAEYQSNDNFIEYEEQTYNELLVIKGQIKGCAIDKENAIDSQQCSGELGNCPTPYTHSDYDDSSKPFKTNDWLLDLIDWPDPGKFKDPEDLDPLIQDNNYCTILYEEEEPTYYCSYEEEWKETNQEISHLSFVEWELEQGNMAGCCLPEQCWTGTECADDQSENPMSPPIEDSYRCIHGSWQESNLKYTWDKEQSGYCQSNDQCLVSPAGTQGDPNNPQCINSNLFIGDHFCEEGNWTTRTKFLALQLLDLAPSNQPYTLYCDVYQNTLNKYDYNDLESFILYPRTNNGSTFSSVNNFCILRYGEDDKVVLATSLNHNIWDETANFLTIFEQIYSCNKGHQGFESCTSSPDYIYYNEEINSIIYSKTSLQLSNPLKDILEFFEDIFNFIIETFTSGPVPGHSPYEFIEQTSDFNQVYISNQEQVVAVKERVWPTQEHLTVMYWGLGADVCESIEVYDTNLGSINSIDCAEDNGVYYISSTLPEGVNIWSLTTAKLRPQIAR